jgi:hypothetical protein
MDDLVAIAAAAVAKHPSVTHVALAGSRARGTHEEPSDWDFAVETSDFAAVARDMPSLVAALDPLGEQWEPLGHFPVYQVFLGASGATIRSRSIWPSFIGTCWSRWGWTRPLVWKRASMPVAPSIATADRR